MQVTQIITPRIKCMLMNTNKYMAGVKIYLLQTNCRHIFICMYQHERFYPTSQSENCIKIHVKRQFVNRKSPIRELYQNSRDASKRGFQTPRF